MVQLIIFNLKAEQSQHPEIRLKAGRVPQFDLERVTFIIFVLFSSELEASTTFHLVNQHLNLYDGKNYLIQVQSVLSITDLQVLSFNLTLEYLPSPLSQSHRPHNPHWGQSTSCLSQKPVSVKLFFFNFQLIDSESCLSEFVGSKKFLSFVIPSCSELGYALDFSINYFVKSHGRSV